MRLILRPRNDRDADCLVDELAAYSPVLMDGAVVMELQRTSHSDLPAILNAAERCLEENDIPSVKIEIDGKGYLMTPAAQ